MNYTIIMAGPKKQSSSATAVSATPVTNATQTVETILHNQDIEFDINAYNTAEKCESEFARLQNDYVNICSEITLLEGKRHQIIYQLTSIQQKYKSFHGNDGKAEGTNMVVAETESENNDFNNDIQDQDFDKESKQNAVQEVVQSESVQPVEEKKVKKVVKKVIVKKTEKPTTEKIVEKDAEPIVAQDSAAKKTTVKKPTKK